MIKQCQVCKKIKNRHGTTWKACSMECRNVLLRGRKLTPEHCRKISKSNKGVPKGPHSEATKQKISKTLMGRFRGPESPTWKGGRWIDERGYVRVPMRPGSAEYEYEHRLVMEKILGRKLEPQEIVHHKGDRFPIDSNENRSDNRPENLQHFQNKSAHNSYHKELDHATK